MKRGKGVSMKKICLLFVLIQMFSFQTVFAESGTCGTNVSYMTSGDTIDFSKTNSSKDAVYERNCTDVFYSDQGILKVKINERMFLPADANDIFAGGSYVQEMDLSKFDTSNVTDMGGMFFGCQSLASLDVSNWDTSNVTDMAGMFRDCRVLKSLDVSNWDTSNVTDMGVMFFECWKLTSLDVSNWDTSNVTDMGGMFRDCRLLKSLDVSNWDTSNVTDMERMFYDCESLASLDLSGWDTSSVSRMDMVFSGCYSLHTITLGRNVLKQYIFQQSLPSYNDTWYYAAPGQYAGNPLSIGSAQQDGLLFSSYDPDTMAGTWSIDFVNTLSQGKYLIIVVDENGAPLPGAAVTWDDQLGTQTGTTDEKGMVFFNAVSYREPVITAEKTNYITWTNADLYWEKNPAGRETIILYPESMGYLKLKSARYSNFRNMSNSTNLLTGTKKLSLGNDAPAWDLDTGSFYLSCKADDPSAVSSYEIWQGEKSVAQSADGFFELNSDNFSQGAGCFIRVQGRDGTHMDTGINLVFSKSAINKEHELSFIGSKISFAVGDNVPFLGGGTWEIDLSKFNVKVPVTGLISENKLRIGFNVDLREGKDPAEQLKEVKKFTQDMKRLMSLKAGKLNGGQTRKYNALIKDKNGFDFLGKKSELSFLGYAEGDWDGGTVTGSMMIMMKRDVAGFEYNTWCVAVPVTVQVGLSIDGTFGGEISYNVNTRSVDGNIRLNAAPKLKAFGGVGVSKLVGVGVYGSAELKWILEVFPALGITDSVDLTGELGI